MVRWNSGTARSTRIVLSLGTCVSRDRLPGGPRDRTVAEYRGLSDPLVFVGTATSSGRTGRLAKDPIVRRNACSGCPGRFPAPTGSRCLARRHVVCRPAAHGDSPHHTPARWARQTPGGSAAAFWAGVGCEANVDLPEPPGEHEDHLARDRRHRRLDQALELASRHHQQRHRGHRGGGRDPRAAVEQPISPKNVPGPSVPSSRFARVMLAVPSTITKHSSPVSPSWAMTLPAGTPTSVISDASLISSGAATVEQPELPQQCDPVVSLDACHTASSRPTPWGTVRVPYGARPCSRALLHYGGAGPSGPPRDAGWVIWPAWNRPRWCVCLPGEPHPEPASCPICVQRNSAVSRRIRGAKSSPVTSTVGSRARRRRCGLAREPTRVAHRGPRPAQPWGHSDLPCDWGATFATLSRRWSGGSDELRELPAHSAAAPGVVSNLCHEAASAVSDNPADPRKRASRVGGGGGSRTRVFRAVGGHSPSAASEKISERRCSPAACGAPSLTLMSHRAMRRVPAVSHSE
jgi:hypothetical protein